ncbi:hypothetical protein BY996DRAFT_6440386 [Phakopsora pachyrhizi]|nr:hypothetical protein BY996DRAFT_6440386 [Phakopsora pachyrhizi]
MPKIVNPVLHNLVDDSLVDQQHSSGGHHSAGRQKFFLVIGLRQRMITSYYQRQTSGEPIELVNFPSNNPLLQVERIDAIADEVQKMNQVASKISLVVMSKMDVKPDDVHDEEYHTMIKGMLSDKEFRKTLPAGQTGSLPGSDLVPLQTNDLTLVSYNTLRWTQPFNQSFPKTQVFFAQPVNRLKPWAVVLIDDQLANQLGVTTRTDDQISRPSVTPIEDSIGHHPPKDLCQEVRQVDNGGKRLTKRWDCPETDYADGLRLNPPFDSLTSFHLTHLFISVSGHPHS